MLITSVFFVDACRMSVNRLDGSTPPAPKTKESPITTMRKTPGGFS